MRGYFGIGIYCPKTSMNIGTLWRSAFQLGASFIFTIGKRYSKQASDTVKAWRHIPLFEYPSFEDFMNHRPNDCILVGIEMGGENIIDYKHSQRAIYLLGAEDFGLPEMVQKACQNIISLPAERIESYNVSVAGSIVMFDRYIKILKSNSRREEE